MKADDRRKVSRAVADARSALLAALEGLGVEETATDYFKAVFLDRIEAVLGDYCEKQLRELLGVTPADLVAGEPGEDPGEELA